MPQIGPGAEGEDLTGLYVMKLDVALQPEARGRATGEGELFARLEHRMVAFLKAR